MLYTIEDKTLTAMGDAIRGYKAGEEISSTDNFTLGYQYRGYPNNKQFSLDGEKIKIRFNSILIDLNNGNLIPYMPNSGYNVGDIGIINYFVSNPGSSDISTRIKSGVELPYEVIADSNEITIYYTGGGSSYPVVIDLELIAVDENGEEYKYTPLEMVDEVNGIIEDFANAPIIPEEALVITGDCNYRFANNGWNWFIEQCGDKITTKDITTLSYMFNALTTLTEIPFDINISKNATAFGNVFYSAGKLKSVPYIIGPERTPPTGSYSGCLNLGSMFSYCNYLKTIPNDYFWRIVPNKDFWDKQATLTSQSHNSLFNGCYSLREHPDISMLGGAWTSAYSNIYYNLFYNCYALDKVENLLVLSNSITSNYFNSTFYNCFMLKELTFETNEDGTPKTANWKNQTIDLTGWVGYVSGSSNALYLYNSGITADKRVSDDATYQALKNDPDWHSNLNNYSRYNHDSAVNTINSLPDCSAYGTNIIKFVGAAGALTDGGAINTLTEEEIAVAAAKGWTVSLS